MFDIENYPEKHVILIRMSGAVSLDILREGLTKLSRAVATHRGAAIAMIADMRDLFPLSPEAASLMGESIASGRKNGVASCAHLTSSGIIRLQANRLSREATPGQVGNFDVVSLEEAWRVTAEQLPRVA
ncbi:MAG: hypothetical protein ABI551_20850 [Polyangiaceae bacterium]